MRILSIRGRGLASLAEAFEVRLDRPPLSGAGVFAITGPTGAGKSTLLDAVCLALFDRTPRLAGHGGAFVGAAGEDEALRVRSDDPRSLLRRGAAEAEASVEFEARDGRRWRATWSVRRARLRADGRLQAADVRLDDLTGGRSATCATKTETLARIRAEIGLSFDQFRRSVLLAQGDFAAFLRASASERAELLETMTGTEIYRRLSMLAFERAREAEASLSVLEARIGETRPLADAERSALSGSRDEARREAAGIEGEHAKATTDLRWHDDRAKLAALVVSGTDAAAAADRAWVGLGGVGSLRDDGARDAADAAVEALGRLEERLAEAERNARMAAGTTSEATRAVRLAAVEHEAATKGLAALEAGIRASDDWLLREAAIGALSEAWPTVRSRLEATVRARQDLSGHARTLARLWQEVGAGAAQPLPAARGACPGPGEALALVGTAARMRDLARAADAARRLRDAALQEASGAHGAANLAREESSAAATRAQELAVRLDEARAARDRDLAARELAEHRSALVEGAPCPLCGATEHPYSQAEPAIDAALAAHGERIRALEEDRRDAAGRSARRSADADASARTAGAAEQRSREHDQARALACSQWAVIARAAGPDAPRDAEDLAAHERLVEEAVSIAAEALRVAAASAEATLDDLGTSLEGVAGWRSAFDADPARAIRDLEGRVREHARRRAERDGLVGSRPDAERRLRVASTSSEASVAEHTRAAANQAQAEALRDGLRAERASRFGGRPTGEVRRALRSATEAHREAAKREADLAAHDRTQRPAGSAAETGERARVLAARRTEVLARVGGLDERLRADDRARERLAALRGDLERAREGARLLRVLRDLIGSGDGSKFRKFAQGLTLDALMQASNGHLAGLRPRYRLERVPGTDMDLQVVDRDLGDDVRSVASLSGGETFLVSLALALGLSSLAAHDVRIETLWVDEGFGTLDPESLECALSVLDSLQATGRQVGMISHVSGLAERLGASVVVEPVGAGISRVRVVA